MAKRNTFIVDILDHQNHTWQGSVRWVQESKCIAFRSALELIQLMESAEREARGGECGIDSGWKNAYDHADQE